MILPEKPIAMPAGEYPAHVVAACLVCEVDPGKLMAWSVRKDAVALVLPTGQKVTFEIAGPWYARQPRLPFEDDRPPAAGHMPKPEDLTPQPPSLKGKGEQKPTRRKAE